MFDNYIICKGNNKFIQKLLNAVKPLGYLPNQYSLDDEGEKNTGITFNCLLLPDGEEGEQRLELFRYWFIQLKYEQYLNMSNVFDIEDEWDEIISILKEYSEYKFDSKEIEDL